MADFINRKARMLILLFPLSVSLDHLNLKQLKLKKLPFYPKYTILVVVSLAKLTYDTTNPRPNIVLHVVGRWALFLQGGLDALTYGWAGARLKRAVHRLEAQRAPRGNEYS
jgi:hypothetical protein